METKNRQKRDILELTAAAVLSLAFFSVPAVLSYRQARATGPSAPVPALPAASPAVVHERPPVVRVVATDVPASLTRPPLAAPVRRTPPSAAAVRPTRGKWAARYVRLPFVRRLARLLSGDGRHVVQPFPAGAGADR